MSSYADQDMNRRPRTRAGAWVLMGTVLLSACGPTSGSPAASSEGPRSPGIDAVFADLEDLMAPASEPAASNDSPAPLTLPESRLREYAGTYRSPELDTTCDLFVESGQLVAEHWRNARSILSPAGEDTFNGDQWWFPEVTFLRDRAGRVTGFTVTAGRVRELIFERG